MECDQFIENLKQPTPVEAHKFLCQVYEEKVDRPDWLAFFANDDKSQFMAHGIEVHILKDWGEVEPDVDAGSDPAFEVPVETVFTVHASEHRTTGHTQVLYQPSNVFTVSYGPHVNKYHALEKEFQMKGDDLESQSKPVQLHCRFRDGRVQVYYMWTPPLSNNEPEWCMLADEEYSPKAACDWQLRSKAYEKELARGRESSFASLLERARHHILYKAAVRLDLEIGVRCEIMDIPADVIGEAYGFALCREMLDPWQIVMKVKPRLRQRYEDRIIQTFLEDVGVDLDAVAKLEAVEGKPEHPKKVWVPDGKTLPEECPQCGNFLIRKPAIAILGDQVPARCPRCWHDKTVNVTDEIRNAFSQYFISRDTERAADSVSAGGSSA